MWPTCRIEKHICAFTKQELQLMFILNIRKGRNVKIVTPTAAGFLVPDELVRVFQKRLISWDLLTLQFTQNGVKSIQREAIHHS